MNAILQSPQTQMMALPASWQESIRREIKAPERIRWMDKPNPKRAMYACTPIVLFAIPWTAFSMFWMWGASGFGGSIKTQGPEQVMHYVFPLFGLPFVLIGVGMLLAPVFAARAAKRTFFFITDQRALIISLGRAVTIKSYTPANLAPIEKVRRISGGGDVLFINELRRSKNGEYQSKTGFEGVMDPDGVAKLLEELKSGVSPA